MTEIWKDVVEYEGYYVVSNRGRVRRIKPGRGILCKILKLNTSKKGYEYVGLTKDSKQTQIFVHRLVLDAFKRKKKNAEQCNHKDGVKNNNRLRNLEWCTPKQNARHSVDVLKKNVGKNHKWYGKVGKDSPWAKEYIIISPEGKKIHVKGLKHFCRENELDTGAMAHVSHGKYKHHKGWRCERV